MDAIKEQSCKQYIIKITILLPSKKAFCKEYKKICSDEEIVKYFYLSVLKEMEKTIRVGDVDKFKNVCKIIEYVNSIEKKSWLRDAYDLKDNPFNENHLVILACKYNKCSILQHIFHPQTKILLNVSVEIGRDELKPTDRDILGHTAFYYAIRENNVDLLNTLWNGWPATFTNDPSHLQQLDDIISHAYAELKLKNASLSEELQFYVEYKLIDLRFFHEAGNFKHRNARPNLSAVKERIELIIECNELLQTEYSGGKKVDDKFIFVATFITQNMDVLKRQIKSTYDRLPWEEIEFCLICFISGHKNNDAINMIYKTVLTKTSILEHLALFVSMLDKEKHNINEANVSSNIPKLRREDVVKNIINKNVALSTLYRDFEEVRNIYSMKKIITYIELALDSDPQETKGQLIIERALLITGEYLKNTLESPNLSDSITDILLCSGLQDNTLLILRSIRNLLSHSQCLKNRIAAMQSNNVNNFYSVILNDLKKIKYEVNEILIECKSNAIRSILKKILELDDLDKIVELISIFKNYEMGEVFGLNNNIKSSERETIEKLVQELKSKITKRTFHQEKLLQEINLILNKGESNVKSSDKMFTMGFVWLTILNSHEFLDKDIIGTKFMIRNFLNKTTSKIDDDGLNRIVHLSTMLYKNMKIKSKQEKSEKLINKLSCNLQNVGKLSIEILDDPSLRKHDEYEEIQSLIMKIAYYSNFRVNQIKGLEALKIKYEENNLDYTTTVNNINENSLNERLKTLNGVLKLSDLEPHKLLSQFDSYNKDLTLQVATESLVFDVMEMTKNFQDNNLLLFDTHCPILIGKCLRNHLAHGNAIVDIFPYSSTRAVLVNAIKLIKEKHFSTLNKNISIGQPIINNPWDLKIRFVHNMNMIKSQEEMFKALQEGNYIKLQEHVRKGAEIKGKTCNNMSALHVAACGGNLNIIKFLLDNGLDIESKDDNGQSPLFVAVSNGNIDIVKYLVEDLKLSIVNVDNSGKTVLHVAAVNGHKNVIEYLLLNNANLNAKDRFGYSPIHYAIINNHKDAVATLLQKEPSADFNELCGGFTPLHIAAEHGHLDLVNYLIENNANINAKNDNNWIPLHGAALKGHSEVVKVLISKGSELNVKSVNGCTPLYYAIENSSETVVKMLLECDGKNNMFYENINSVLPFACYLGNEVIVELLLKYNVNVNTQTNDGQTPSHHAAERGKYNILNMLVKQGANINIENNNGDTPLKLAIRGNHIEAVEVLLQHGANVNQMRGCQKLTPLHVAASVGNEMIIRMLIKWGAKINVLNIDGYLPIHLATQLGHKNSVKTLIDYGAEYNNLGYNILPPIHMAATVGHAEIVDIFLQQNVDVNSVANFEVKITPLHCAALTGDLDTVTTLLNKGANIDQIGFGNYTPLHLAVEMGNQEVFKYMFKKTKLVVSDSNFAPYLHSAVRQSNSEIVDLLMKNGVKASVENLSIAILSNNTDVVKTILKYQNFDLNAKHENVTLITLAAMNGNKHIVKILLQYGADPNEGDFLYPLSIAAYFNNVEIIHVLLKSRAYVNVRSCGGFTPLHFASERGHTNVVEILLDNGADTEMRDDKNRTALEIAIANKHFSVIKTLFQNSALNINTKGNDDWSLLHIAAQGGDCDIVKYLIREGADVHVKNSSGSKPIHIAAREGHAHLVDLFLCEGLSLYEAGAANQTILHYATLKNQIGVIKFLTEKSFDVNAKDANGWTSLHFAAKFGFKEIIEILLNNCAIYNAVDNFDLTPADLTENSQIKRILKSTKNLFECVKQNKYLDVENHVRNGACIKAKNTGDVTTLHYAAWKGFNETVISLLKNNADPNISGKNGYSCLHFASKFGHIDVVKSLLANGAVYNAKDHNGKTPLYFAEKKVIIDLLNLISDCFDKVDIGSPRVIDILKSIKDIDTIKAIMNAHNRNRQSLIVVAIKRKYPLVELLKNLCQMDVAAQKNKAESLITQEMCQEALDILKNILQKRKEIFCANNPSILDIEYLIASALYKQRKFKEALRIHKEVYDRQKIILGENCEDTLCTKSAIGLVLHRLGENEEALVIYKEVFKKQQEILGKTDSRTLQTQLHMALVFDGIGRYDEALKNNQEVFEMSTVSGDSLMTLSSQNNMAMVLGHQKKYEDAIKTYKDVYERKKKILGPYHSDTLRTLHNIGTVYFESKDIKKALNAFKDVYEIQKSHLGPSHLDTLYTQTNIADILFRDGKVYGALKHYKQCYNQMKAILGENHPNVVSALVNMNTITEVSKFKGHVISDIVEDDTMLYTAVDDQNIELVKDILSSGIDINTKDGEGRTALHYAANTGNIQIFRLLLKNNADIFQVTNKGNTPLHTAASKGFKEVMEDMLRHVKSSNPRRVSELLDAKTSIGGTTALHICTQKGNHEHAVVLLQYGACYNIKNAQLKSPIQVAKSGSEIVTVLSYIDRLFLALQLNQKDKVESLVKEKYFEVESTRKAILYARDSNGKTLLQVAYKEAAQFLLQKLKSP